MSNFVILIVIDSFQNWISALLSFAWVLLNLSSLINKSTWVYNFMSVYYLNINAKCHRDKRPICVNALFTISFRITIPGFSCDKQIIYKNNLIVGCKYIILQYIRSVQLNLITDTSNYVPVIEHNQTIILLHIINNIITTNTNTTTSNCSSIANTSGSNVLSKSSMQSTINAKVPNHITTDIKQLTVWAI